MLRDAVHVPALGAPGVIVDAARWRCQNLLPRSAMIRLVPVFFDRFRLWLGQHVLWTAAAAYVLVVLAVLAAGQLRVKRGRSSDHDQLSMRQA